MDHEVASDARPPKAPASPAPFTLITGAVYPGEPSWSTPEERRAALGRWIPAIAREVGKRFDTHSERSAAEAFVRSHRLSIANAFQCKLVRKDVVAELTRLFESQQARAEPAEAAETS